MSEHTLRIELSHKNAQDFSETGIITFDDISEVSLNKALELILKRLNSLVYYDSTINKKVLNKVTLRNLYKYSNPNYWLNNLKPNKRDKHKKNLQKIIDSNSSNLLSSIRNDLRKKGVIINRAFKKSKEVIIDTSNIGLNLTHNQHRKCPITGIDLKHEKSDAKYIRTSTINYLKKYNSEIFIILCSRFIPNNGKTPKYETDIVSRLCKNIRNSYYNQTQIKQVGYNSKTYPNQLQLDI